MKAKTLAVLMLVGIMLIMSACSSKGSNTPKNEGTNASSNSGGGQKTEDSGMPDFMGHKAEAGAELVVYVDVGSKKFVDSIAADFKEQTGVTIKRVEEVSGEDISARLEKEGPAGTGPDVLEDVNSEMEHMSDFVLPNDIFKKETEDTMLENTLAPISWDGVLYGYPTSLETYIMFYNKDLMPQKPETWDQIKDFAKTFNDPGQKKYACMCPIQEGYMGFLYMAGNGGYVFGSNGTDVKDIGLNNAGSIEGMEYYKSFKPFLPVATTDMSRDLWRTMFKEGKTAMIVDGPWAMDSFVGANTGYTTLPKFPSGKDPGGFNGIKALYVSQYTKYPIAAKMFAFFYSNDQNALKFYQMTKNPPANKAAINDPTVQSDPVTSVFIKQFSYGIAQTGAAEFGEWWNIADPIFSKIWDDGADVKTTLDEAAEKMKAGIAKLPKNQK